MQFLTLAALIAVFWFWMRRPEDHSRASEKAFRRDKQLDALTRRVTTLETILLDRDRQLRDRFGDL